MKTFLRQFLSVWLPFVAMSSWVASVQSADQSPIATIDTAWDALFTRLDGWTGGDVAGTVDLKDGRVLWLFGDSWIGQVKDGKHLPGSHLVNNTAAIHSHDVTSPAKPPDALQFLVGRPADKGLPAAWIAPLQASGGRQPPDSPSPKINPNPDQLNPPNTTKKSWYWTTGGGITVMQSGRPSLYVFLFRVQKSGAGNGVWDFRIVGTTMAIFDDIRQPVEDWQPRLIDIPHSFDRPGDPGKTEPKWLAWGVASLTDSTGDDEVMIYGVRRESKLRDDLVLAKVRADEIEKFDQWQFFVEPNQWSKQLDDSRPVAQNVPKELSVERTHEGTEYVMIHSEPILGPGIFLRKAQRPEGPWSPPQLVHRVTDKTGDRRFFAYAAKGHLLLANPNEILVTYVVNSHEFPLMFQDASIYRPRCLRVKLSP